MVTEGKVHIVFIDSINNYRTISQNELNGILLRNQSTPTFNKITQEYFCFFWPRIIGIQTHLKEVKTKVQIVNPAFPRIRRKQT